MKTEYYSLSEISKTHANYYVIFGERSNGKTYSCKQLFIENYCRNGKQFAYVRRRAEEIKTDKVVPFFNDIGDYLNSECKKAFPAYDSFSVRAKSGRFILIGYKETGEPEEIGVMGYYFALATARYNKSVPYPDITIFVYDEFMTDGSELPNEFSILLNLISTIKRKREDFEIYLLGNTVNRNSSILHAMGINIRDIPKGAIKCFEYHEGDNLTNRVAVEYCRNYAQSSESESFFVFNSQRELMIRKGEWETDEYSCFSEDEFYNTKFTLNIVFECENFRLYGYGDPTGYLWVSDKRLKNTCNYLTLTTEPTFSYRNTYNWNCGIDKINILEERINLLVQNGKVKYKNNLVGDDFRQFLIQANTYRNA